MLAVGEDITAQLLFPYGGGHRAQGSRDEGTAGAGNGCASLHTPGDDRSRLTYFKILCDEKLWDDEEGNRRCILDPRRRSSPLMGPP